MRVGTRAPGSKIKSKSHTKNTAANNRIKKVHPFRSESKNDLRYGHFQLTTDCPSSCLVVLGQPSVRPLYEGLLALKS